MSTVIDALRAFVNARPGIDPRNYGDRASYRAESRAVTRDMHDALQLLAHVQSVPMSHVSMAFALHHSRGRLSATPTDNGWRIDYTTGQYWPTEYRKAVARACARELWDIVHREHPEWNADNLRAHFRRVYGRRIASRYFS
jgi:hypothetical protein